MLESGWRAAAVTVFPGFAVPVSQCDSCWRRVQTFPPHSSVTGLADISEDGVFGDGGHGVRVGLVRGAGCDAKETVLRVDGSQLTCRWNRVRVFSALPDPGLSH